MQHSVRPPAMFEREIEWQDSADTHTRVACMEPNFPWLERSFLRREKLAGNDKWRLAFGVQFVQKRRHAGTGLVHRRGFGWVQV